MIVFHSGRPPHGWHYSVIRAGYSGGYGGGRGQVVNGDRGGGRGGGAAGHDRTGGGGGEGDDAVVPGGGVSAHDLGGAGGAFGGQLDFDRPDLVSVGAAVDAGPPQLGVGPVGAGEPARAAGNLRPRAVPAGMRS